jgi:ParB/RepB/Spo0J family partition protein
MLEFNPAIKTVLIEDIDESLDVRANRIRDEKPEEFEALVDSIRQHGIIEPIIVRPINSKDVQKYQIIAGNRRLEAARELNLRTIPAIIRDANDAKVRRLAFIENVHRLNLRDTEKAKNIALIYQDIGYSAKEAIQVVKHLHNIRNSSNKEISLLLAKNDDKKVLVDVKSFIDAFKDISYSANYQYQHLQLVKDIDPEILELADRKGLGFQSKLMLANKDFKSKDKQEQKSIVSDVAQYKGKAAHKKIKNSIAKPSERKEQTGRKNNLLELSLDIGVAIDKLIFLITDIKLSRGQVFYKEEIIDAQQDKIFALIKAMGDTSQLDAFEEQISILKYAIRKVESTIAKVRDSNEKQKDLIKP